MILHTKKPTSQSTNQATNILLQQVFPNECSVYVVTTAWRVLRLRIEQHPILVVAVNILNTQSRTDDKGWSPSLGVGQGADNSSP